MPPEKIDSLANEVKSMVLERLNSRLTARVDELVTHNEALLVRIQAPLPTGRRNGKQADQGGRVLATKKPEDNTSSRFRPCATSP
jgi:hypothetical protein